MAKKSNLNSGAMINDALTFYLYGIHTLRKRRLSAAEAMHHVVDLGTTALDLKNRMARRGATKSRG